MLISAKNRTMAGLKNQVQQQNVRLAFGTDAEQVDARKELKKLEAKMVRLSKKTSSGY